MVVEAAPFSDQVDQNESISASADAVIAADVVRTYSDGHVLNPTTPGGGGKEST